MCATGLRVSQLACVSLIRDNLGTTMLKAFVRSFLVLSHIFGLSFVAFGQSDFIFVTNNATITITGYTGSGGHVDIPNLINGRNVLAIGQKAFEANSLVTSVAIPTSVTLIGAEAFENCANLTNVVFPDSALTIGSYAFSQTGLRVITIPRRTVTIAARAFQLCSQLAAINVDPANVNYTSVDGVLFNKALTTLIQFPVSRGQGYQVPNSVTTISDTAFATSDLTSVQFPQGLRSIGNDAFGLCTNLTSVVLPNSLTNLGTSAFLLCTALTNITLGTNLPAIPAQAFSACSSLERVTIPASVKSFGGNAFYECPKMKTVIFLGNAPIMGAQVFSSDVSTTVLYLPGTLGWGSTLAGRPALLWNPRISSSQIQTGSYSLTITGTAGLNVVTEASELMTPGSWTAVATNTVAGGQTTITDPVSSPAMRFYRLRSP
jgi:hypothetical protein